MHDLTERELNLLVKMLGDINIHSVTLEELEVAAPLFKRVKAELVLREDDVPF